MSNTLQYEVVDVNKIKIVGDNPNEMTALQTQSLKHSIDKFDLVQPILIDQNDNLIDGHQRFNAIKSRGDKTIAVIRKDVKDEIERLLLIQALNKVRGQHSEELDAKIYMKVIEADQNNMLDLMAFVVEEDEQKIYNLIQKYNPDYVNKNSERDDDLDKLPDPETIKDPITKTGDIWQLGDHKLLCGDSGNRGQVNSFLNNEKANMVFSDPPYNLGYDFHNNGMVETGQRKARFGSITNDDMTDDEYYKFIKNIYQIIKENIYDGASYYITGRRESTIIFNSILKDLDFHIQSWLVWVKEHFNISRFDYHPKHEIITYGWKKGSGHNWYSDRSQTDVLNFERLRGKTQHPTEKPVALIEYLINNSTNKNDLIFDFFLGSGSTLIACEQTNRICFGIEIDPRYIQVILQRWVNLTGGDPIRLNDNKKWSELNV